MSWKTAIAGSLAAALIIATVPCSAAEDVVIKVWSRADRSGPLRAGNLVTAGDTFVRAVACLREGRAADAGKLCSELLLRQPTHAGALHVLGIVAAENGRPAAAVDFPNLGIFRKKAKPESTAKTKQLVTTLQSDPDEKRIGFHGSGNRFYKLNALWSAGASLKAITLAEFRDALKAAGAGGSIVDQAQCFSHHLGVVAQVVIEQIRLRGDLFLEERVHHDCGGARILQSPDAVEVFR